MVLTDILKEKANKIPNALAATMRMGFRTINLTYLDVYILSCKVACLLEKEGIDKQDKILLLAPNSPYWICAFWGCLLRGVVVVPLNIQSTPDMVEKIAQQTGAKLFFAHRFYRHKAPSNLKRYDIDLFKEILQSCGVNQDALIHDAKEDDLIEILYTSGTTGDPKGVMLSHKNLYSNINAISQFFKFKENGERFLSILPLSHIFEQAIGFLAPFFYGAHIIYVHSHAAIRDLSQEYHVTKMLVVPEFLKLMMAKVESQAEEQGRKKLLNWLMNFSLKLGNKRIARLLFYSIHKKLGGSLDTIMCGGAPLDPVLEKKWSAIGIFLLQGYGLTETSPLVSANTYKDHRFASIGKVVPGVQVRLEGGEIQVKGPNIFGGYFKDEQRTKDAFADGSWFKTSDMGEFDDDGFLFLRGRKKYMILSSGGQNVFPEDIEEVLRSFGEFKDCTVTGIEQPSGAIQIHAVFLRDGKEADAVRVVEQANKKLASYQQIGGWSMWPEQDFPRSATKKVKKDAVIEFLLQQQEADIVAVPERKDPLITLLADITGMSYKKITESTKIVTELQLDSLMRVELIARIEEDYGIFVDETKITLQTTVNDLYIMIREQEPIKSLPKLKRWPRLWWAAILRSIGQSIVLMISRLFVKIRVKGKENLENLQYPVIFMPNHVSYIDPFVVMLALPRFIRRAISFAAANDVLYGEYKHLSHLGELLFNTFPFPRKEKENIKLGLDYMGRLLDKQYSVVIFPEGQMSIDAKLLPLKKGAGLVAVEMDSVIVPVKIEGSESVLPYGKVIPRRRDVVTVTFGKPLRFKSTDSHVEVTEKIELAMREL